MLCHHPLVSWCNHLQWRAMQHYIELRCFIYANVVFCRHPVEFWWQGTMLEWASALHLDKSSSWMPSWCQETMARWVEVLHWYKTSAWLLSSGLLVPRKCDHVSWGASFRQNPYFIGIFWYLVPRDDGKMSWEASFRQELYFAGKVWHLDVNCGTSFSSLLL